MDFRRIPFQFSSTDPAKRQAELQKRFGLPVNSDKDKMHIDFNDPGLMGIRPEGMSSGTSSPRLQHRIPIFKEGSPEPMKTSVDSQGSPAPGRKPHVRVVPIEIEGEDNVPKRHRNLSGSTSEARLRNGFPTAEPSFRNGFSWLPDDMAASTRPPVDPKPNPRERTIPIKVEVGAKKAKTVPIKKPPSPLKKEPVPKMNGCTPSKVDSAPKVKVDSAPPKVEKAPSEPSKPQPAAIELSKKKIDSVLEKLKSYHADVEKFTGTPKEKQYRYLDEMLTRLMLELDDVDTMGNEEVRLARKAAVRQVQASVDLLEARVTRERKPEENKDVEMEVSSSQDQSEEPIAKDGISGPVADSTVAEDQSKVVTEPEVSEAEMVKGDMSQEITEPEDTIADSTMPEDQSQVVTEPVVTEADIKDVESSQEPALEKVDVIQDVEMDSEAEATIQPEEGKLPENGSVEIPAEEKEVMEVDSEPVVTTSSPEESPCCKQCVVSEVQIEEVDAEYNDSGSVSCSNEPLVTLPDSPAKEQSNKVELDPVPEEPTKELESDILSDTTECVAELLTKSCHGDVSDVSVPKGLANELNTDQS